MKTIDTLIEDIYALFGSGKEFSEVLANKYGELMAQAVTDNVPRPDAGGYLRGSALGKACMREKWYTVNQFDKHEGFEKNVKFKFLYGNILEEVVLYLAQEAGHTVTGQQDSLQIGPVVGHRDAVIDGMLVDVKSCVPFTFWKFQDGLKESDDSFGYCGQLQSYLWASQDDPLVTIKDKCAFLAVEKLSGEMTLDVHNRDMRDWGAIAEKQLEIVNGEIPPRNYGLKAEGAKGNQKLGTNCSYCSFKKTCWPGLRSFAYKSGRSTKVTHLAKVVQAPSVPEVT